MILRRLFPALALALLLGDEALVAQQTKAAEPPPPAPTADVSTLEAPKPKPADERADEAPTTSAPCYLTSFSCGAYSAASNARYAAGRMFAPMTYLLAGAAAGVSQARNSDRSYGQGMSGYGKRYGARLADAATYELFGDFLLPSALRQDARFQRLGSGSSGARAWRAIRASLIAKNADCRATLNLSNLGGAALSSGLSFAYYPQNERSAGRYFARFGVKLASGVGRNLWREFGPDVMSRLRRRR